jgi:hypothetical protein
MSKNAWNLAVFVEKDLPSGTLRDAPNLALQGSTSHPRETSELISTKDGFYYYVA